MGDLKLSAIDYDMRNDMTLAVRIKQHNLRQKNLKQQERARQEREKQEREKQERELKKKKVQLQLQLQYEQKLRQQQQKNQQQQRQMQYQKETKMSTKPKQGPRKSSQRTNDISPQEERQFREVEVNGIKIIDVRCPPPSSSTRNTKPDGRSHMRSKKVSTSSLSTTASVNTFASARNLKHWIRNKRYHKMPMGEETSSSWSISSASASSDKGTRDSPRKALLKKPHSDSEIGKVGSPRPVMAKDQRDETSFVRTRKYSSSGR